MFVLQEQEEAVYVREKRKQEVVSEHSKLKSAQTA